MFTPPEGREKYEKHLELAPTVCFDFWQVNLLRLCSIGLAFATLISLESAAYWRKEETCRLLPALTKILVSVQ